MKIGDIMERTECVGVIGAGECADSVYDLPRQVGHEIGERGWMLICGGLGGVMATKFLFSG
jgi:predicted Rossmann-fold nucleotide-binding protein